MIQYSTIGLLFFIVYVNISTISGLTCYDCLETKGRGTACEKNVESVEQKECGDPPADNCVLFETQSPGSTSVLIFRKCLLPCEDVKNLEMFSKDTFISCYDCNTDLCNSMPVRSSPPHNGTQHNKKKRRKRRYYNNTLCNKASLSLIVALLLLLAIFK